MAHPHDREILRLAVPAFLALVAEPLFLLSDAAIVGHLGTPELAGQGIAAVVLQTAVGLCIFLAYGTTASVARHLGAGDEKGALAQGVDGVWLAVLIGVVVTVLGVALTEPLVAAFGAGSSVEGFATTYLRIAWLGTTPLLVMLATTGVLRGLQDTRTPLVVAVLGNGVNVVLNLVLVYGVGGFDGLGIAGSAIGTVLAQLFSAAALLVVVVRGARASGASLAPDLPGHPLRGSGRGRAGDPHGHVAGVAPRHDGRRHGGRLRTGPAGRPRHAPGRDHAVGVPGVRARRDRDRRAGDHRPLPRCR